MLLESAYDHTLQGIHSRLYGTLLLINFTCFHIRSLPSYSL